MSYSTLVLYLLSGAAIITIIDTLGAILSRVLQFKYVYLSVLSATLYILMGYQVSQHFNLTMVIAINAVLGLYDGSAGLWFSLKLNANVGDNRDEAAQMLSVSTAIVMMIIAVVLGLIGYALK